MTNDDYYHACNWLLSHWYAQQAQIPHDGQAIIMRIIDSYSQRSVAARSLWKAWDHMMAL